MSYDAVQNVLYVADVGNRSVRKISLSGNRKISTVLTSADASSAGISAGFAGVSSLGVRGVGVAPNGRLYITDAVNQVVWVKPPSNPLRLYVGSPGAAGLADGVGTAARFRNPELVAVSRDGLIITVTEPERCALRLIQAGGIVSTIGVAGCGQ